MEIHPTAPWFRMLLSVALVIAPALVLLSAIAFVLEGEGDNDGEIGGIIQVWGFIAFSLVLIRLTSQFAAARPSAAAVLLLLGMAGVSGGVAYGIDAIQADIFNTESIQDPSSAAGPLALQLPGILFPVSLLGIALMLIQSRSVPLYAGIFLAVGAVLFPLGNIPNSQALTIVANAVLTVAGVLLALTVDRNEAEDTPRTVAAGQST